MWMVNNRTAYAADRNWVRDKEGRHHWIVSVRATFDIDAEGRLTLSDEQAPPSLAPEYLGKPAESSLRYDSDLLYIAPCTDLIVEANAHASGGRAQRTVSVSLRVGPVSKQLHVHGASVYYKALTGQLKTSDPKPFVSRPITYEWAYGGMDCTDPEPRKQGMDDRNPVGKGFALKPDHLVDSPVPAIEYPGKDLKSAGPAGFGPIDPAWMPRRGFAGTYDEAWERHKKPLLPDDYDPRYGSSAPADQRVDERLRGGEPVELLGMTESGVLRFLLPRIYLTFTSHFARRRVEHRGKLATVLLLPEQRQVALIWQSSLMVSARDCDYLDQTDVREKAYLS